MKLRLLATLVGLAIDFALTTFAQQASKTEDGSGVRIPDTPNPRLHQAIAALYKKYDEAFDNNDGSALAALFTEDAVLVTNIGTIKGREAIEEMYKDLFKQVHFSNQLTAIDQDSPRAIGTAGNEIWGIGVWSNTIQSKDCSPEDERGSWGSITVFEDGIWKNRMQILNITSAPAETPSPPASPSSQ
jgi:ketosteroid isomerase-like protein